MKEEGNYSLLDVAFFTLILSRICLDKSKEAINRNSNTFIVVKSLNQMANIPAEIMHFEDTA
ncbi:hypothetical protein K0H71_20240 [Bacillus sp. IITD106]|nr:hypothetical protein [Bacillus sp. IITD106]